MKLYRATRVLQSASMALASILLAGALGSCTTGSVSSSRHALVYGVSLYQTMYGEGQINTKNLTYTDDDAYSLAQTLAENGWDDVRPSYKGSVGFTTSSPPTRDQILSDIGSLSSLSSGDTVLLYFSGHGTSVNGEFYLVPYLGVNDDASGAIVYGNCLSSSELDEALSKLPTNKVIVILDSCYSGGFVDAGSAIDTAPQDYGPNDEGIEASPVATAFANFGALLAANAISRGATPPIVISAAGSEELSYEKGSPYGHGLFTFFILKAVAEADANGDGYITTTEAYEHASAGVKSDWNAYYWNEINEIGSYADYLPRISGGARDLVLFATK
jgi:hypothetical protein